jgi:hypothetical protein
MRKSMILAILFLLAPALFAQNSQTATGGGASLWVGAEYSSFNPDYGCAGHFLFYCGSQGGLLRGIGAVVDLNLHPKWGAEGEARWLPWNGIGGETESSYLIGPRYRLVRFGKADLWGKMMFGGGSVITPNYSEVGGTKGSFFVYAPGLTLDYRLTSRLSFRADYEYQIWPSFAGPSTTSGGTTVEHNHGLTPNGVSVGVTWRFRGW